MTESKAGSKRITGGERRHVILVHVINGDGKSGEEAARKNASGLERREAEDLAGMRHVIAPIHHDVEHFGANNAEEHDENAEIPGFFRIDALALRHANADDQADHDAGRDQQAVGGQVEITDVKKAREHCLYYRCPRRAAGSGVCSTTKDTKNHEAGKSVIRTSCCFVPFVVKERSRPTEPCGGPRMNPS